MAKRSGSDAPIVNDGRRMLVRWLMSEGAGVYSFPRLSRRVSPLVLYRAQPTPLSARPIQNITLLIGPTPAALRKPAIAMSTPRQMRISPAKSIMIRIVHIMVQRRGNDYCPKVDDDGR